MKNRDPGVTQPNPALCATQPMRPRCSFGARGARAKERILPAEAPLLGLAAALLLLGLLAPVAMGVTAWMLARPVQAAPPAFPDPTPTPLTGETAPGLLPSPTAVPPTATPALPSLTVTASWGANVRSGPDTAFPAVGYLPAGAEAPVIGRSGAWWQITYIEEPAWVHGEIVSAANADDVPEVASPPTPIPARPDVIPKPASPEDIAEARWVDVDLRTQQLTAYEDGQVVRTSLISSGLPNTPTPTGQFRVWLKLEADDMSGADYYLEDVPFVMYFYGGYALHGVTWHGNFGQPMSHGCVNLPTAEAEWLFNWASEGTLVNVRE